MATDELAKIELHERLDKIIARLDAIEARLQALEVSVGDIVPDHEAIRAIRLAKGK